MPLSKNHNNEYKLITMGSFADLSADQKHQLSVMGPEYFTTLEWFELLSDTTLDSNSSLRLYVMEMIIESDNNLACIPMITQTTRKNHDLTALSNFYSPVFSPLVKQPQIYELAQAFSQSVASERPRWDIINFQPIDSGNLFFRMLLNSLRQEKFIVDTYPSHSNWYLEVAGRSFSEYSKSLPSILCNTLQRAYGKLSRNYKFSTKIICEDDGRLDHWIRAYESIYAHSWKKPEPYTRFIPRLCHLAGKRGILRLGILELEGLPVAAQIWLVFNGTASIFKLAYDQRYAKLSVGSILTAAMMKHVIDIDRVDLVDYLTGNEPYKKLWMSHRQDRYGIVAFNPATLHGLLHASRHYVGKVLTQFNLTISSIISKVSN